MNLRDTIIDLDDGSKYVVRDYILYAGKTYILMIQTSDEEDDISGDPVIAELENNNVSIVNDEELKSKLTEIFKLNITE